MRECGSGVAIGGRILASSSVMLHAEIMLMQYGLCVSIDSSASNTIRRLIHSVGSEPFYGEFSMSAGQYEQFFGIGDHQA